MTAPATTRRAGPFNGNGATTSFPFEFKVFATTDIAVVKASTTGIESTLVLGSDYSVTLNADQDDSPGGSITYPISGTPLAVGEKLTAIGALPYDQTAELPTGGNYRAVVIENALDRTVFQVQQLAEEIGRSLTLPPSAAAVNAQLPAPEGGKVIAWNAAGTALVNVNSSDLASVVVAGSAYTDVFSGTGSQTAFTLTADPGGVNALDVAISGVSQVNGVDFTVSGTTLTFTAAPASGTDNIAVRYVASVPVGSSNAVDVTYNATGAGSSGRAVSAKLDEWISPDDKGAVGDGTTEDTVAFQRALDTGRSVRGRPGATYLIGPTSQATAGQVIDMSGCTVKRIAASTHAAMLTTTAADVVVCGGTWDGNKAAQSGSSGDRYTHACITFTGDRTVVRDLTTTGAWGIGVKGASCSSTAVIRTTNLDYGLFGVYVESTGSDESGNVIEGNVCRSTSELAGSGVYLTGSNAPFTYKQRDWRVAGNICHGSTDASVTGIGITTRGIDGVICDNQTVGFTMGISADLAAGTTITGNRCVDMAGGSAYGIELNNSKCTVTGNITRGGRYGVVGSGNAAGQDYSVVTGNLIDGFSVAGVFFNPSAGGFTARHLKITGNTIIFGGTTTNRSAIRLGGDCKYADLEGNKIVGPGKSISGCRGVYLDNVVSNVNVRGGSMSGLERAITLYTVGAVAHTDITFIGTDCALDMNDDASHMAAEGGATIGARCVQRDISKGGTFPLQYDDRQNSVLETWGAGSPEGAITAGVGSRYYRTDGGATTTLYVKTSGTGNTGWTAK